MVESRRNTLLSTPVLVIVGRFGGLLIPFFIAHCFGVSPSTDAFFLVLGAVLLLLETFSHLLESVIVPDLTALKSQPRRMFSFANSVLLVNLFVIAAGGIVFALAGPSLLHLIYGAEQDAFTRKVMQIGLEMLPFLFLGACTCLANGLFFLHKIFWFPAISPLLRSVIILGFILAGHSIGGIHAAALGFTFGEAFRVVLSFFLLRKKTLWSSHIQWEETRKDLRAFVGHGGFQIMALFAFHLYLITDQWMASFLGAGKLSLQSYADRLFLIPYHLFGAGLLHILHSDWSDIYHQKSSEGFFAKMKTDVWKLSVICILFSSIAWLFRTEIVALGFGHGEILPEEREVIANLFGWMMIGLTPAILNLAYSRVSFILKKSRFYFVYSWVRLGLKLLLNYFAMRYFGLTGIVVSTVAINFLTAFSLHFYLSRLSKFSRRRDE